MYKMDHWIHFGGMSSGREKDGREKKKVSKSVQAYHLKSATFWILHSQCCCCCWFIIIMVSLTVDQFCIEKYKKLETKSFGWGKKTKWRGKPNSSQSGRSILRLLCKLRECKQMMEPSATVRDDRTSAHFFYISFFSNFPFFFLN